MTYRFGNMVFLVLCHILAKFEEANKKETPEYQALLANKEFCKVYLIQKFSDEWKKGIQRLRDLPEEKPVTCPECNSEDIVSYDSLKWRCKNCGKYFLKNPRSAREERNKLRSIVQK